MYPGFHVARLLAVLVRDVIVCEALAGPCGGPGRVLRPVLCPGNANADNKYRNVVLVEPSLKSNVQ